MTEKDAETLRLLVEKCRDQLEHDLCELVDELGPTLIEATRNLANTRRDEARRRACVTLQHEIQEFWRNVAPALRETLKRRRILAAQPGQPAPASKNLQILSDSETFVHIARQEVIDTVSAACREETNAMDRRLSYLVLRSALQPNDSTFRVASLCESLESCWTKVTDDTTRQIMLLQLVGEHLAAELPQLYRVINETLIEADILPRLKRSYYSGAPVNDVVAEAETARMTSSLEKLVKARTATNSPTSSTASGIANQELFRSLNVLDKGPATNPTGGLTNVVRLARDSDAARHVRPQEAVTLDVVAELFDLIFSDKQVADGIKTLVARLQTPVLKVAMLNQQFFADRSHPVRRFLNSISGIAVRWGKSVNADDPFYRKLSELVDKIQNSYDADANVFDTANAQLASFLAEREAIESEESRILADAVHAREEEIRAQRQAQLQAQRIANQELAKLIGTGTPIEIEHFLQSYWRDVLQHRIFSFGADSPEAAEALQVASDLLWDVTPKHTREDRQRQASLLPSLLSRLNAGFDQIGVSAIERREFMDKLLELQLAALRAEKRLAAQIAAAAARKSRPAASSSTLQISHATQNGVRVQDISLPEGEVPGKNNTPDRSETRRVRQLVRGDWVDFITAGQTRRERLTWINPSHTLLLFSNSAAECAISITPDALAVRLKNQTAKLVKLDTPIFERALHGAVQCLETRETGTAPTTDA